MPIVKVNSHLSIDTDVRVIHRGNFDHPYSADCFVNVDSFDAHPWREGNGKEQLAYVVCDAGFVRAIVFAEYYRYSEQDALDEAADSGKLDYLQVEGKELEDYEVGKDSDGYPEYEGLITLGNASEYFDQENLELWTVPARLFALDAEVMAVIEEQSRVDAVEVMQDCQANKDEVETESGSDFPAGYHILANAIDYLRSEDGRLDVSCTNCHRTRENVERHREYFPQEETCCHA